MSRGRLHKRILWNMVLLLFLLGLMIAFATRAILFQAMKTQYKQFSISHARGLAANSLADVLTLNTSRLKKLIESEMKSNADIAYVFITNASGQILAHSFPKGFPVDLIEANHALAGNEPKVQLLDTKQGIVCDVAAPIFLDKSLLGEVRVGLGRWSIQRMLVTIDLAILGITFIIIFVGIFLANRLSNLITRPVSRLVEAIQSVRAGDFSTKINGRPDDEIGLLSGAFNEMTERLRHLVEEVAVLTRFKERERIALDLHDGCAQNMVSILKRIELCERHVKTGSGQAAEELRQLKEEMRNTLSHTRQVIFDLKSCQDGDSCLTDRIRLYLQDYEKINNIAVQLDCSGLFDKLSAETSEPLFYIVTEALSNVRKHSRAKHVMLRMESESRVLKIFIKDDGQGFDVESQASLGSQRGKYGLAGMRQRSMALGGRLTISSVPGKGSRVALEVPF